MSGADVIGLAQTGTGKTIAYLLPILRTLRFSNQRHPRILILVPTRELVLQVVREIEKLGKYMTLRVDGVYGGANINVQKQKVYDGLDILVATPGRLYDLVMSGVLRLKDVQKVVVDEVDEMLNQGFKAQLISILDMLPAKRQNLMFSATLTEPVKDIITDYFSNPELVEVAAHGTPLDKIEQLAYQVPNFNTKVNLLKHLLANPQLAKVLVFVNSKKQADILFELLSKVLGDTLGVIHSNKSQNFRINTITRFTDGTCRVLLATDVVARGIDVHGVSHVINFELSDEAPDYIHRIGRTGRAGQSGVAITFVTETELPRLFEIEQLIKRMVIMEPIPAEVTVSNVFNADEKPKLFDVDYLKNRKPKTASASNKTKTSVQAPKSNKKKAKILSKRAKQR